MDNINFSVAGFADDSIVDGPGMRFTIFMQGCPHHCPNCHNPEAQPFTRDNLVPMESILAKIDNNPIISGVTFSGGDPFSPVHVYVLSRLVPELRKRELNIIAYTGYTIEELINRDGLYTDLLIHSIDYIIDGPFIQSLKSLECPFRGSTNQRILRCPRCQYPSLFPEEMVDKTLQSYEIIY